MDAFALAKFVGGLLMLIAGAELLVRGASRLAAAVGIPPLVIGLTVVAYGTSSPELAISLQAISLGHADVALGNVVGSNIFNVLFIAGLVAVVNLQVVSRQLVRLDVPIMIIVSVLLLVLALDGEINRLDGTILFAGALSYTVWTIVQGRKANDQATKTGVREVGAEGGRSAGLLSIQLGLILVGLALLVLGSRWLIDGALTFARVFGLSELVIGLTIVAAGTSLPEVATSIVASIRRETDIALGNIIGSNIFNILAVLGLTGIFAPAGIDVAAAALNFDIPVMIAVAIACLPIFFTGYVIARWEGALFFICYLAYTTYLLLNATKHAALPLFSGVMMYFVIPLTILTLLVLVVRAARSAQSVPNKAAE